MSDGIIKSQILQASTTLKECQEGALIELENNRKKEKVNWHRRMIKWLKGK